MRTFLNRRRFLSTTFTGTALLWSSKQGLAQEDESVSVDEVDMLDAAQNRLQYDSPKVETWKFGLVLNTPVTCTNVFSTFVIPMEWPEQKVTLVGQQVDGLISGWEDRDLPGGAKQIALRMAKVPAGSTVELTVQFEIERSRILPPEKTDDLEIPKRATSELRLYLSNSPNIDTSHARIRKAARELGEKEVENDWERVEQIYDFVREKVEYVEGPIRNASDALKDGRGDCEDMTSLFVALCRNFKIPSRMVWIPDHCYPEFYLESTPDPSQSAGSKPTGFWFPCQAAGTRQFGRMDEYRPILQKGDRFKVEERKSKVRYVSEFFKCDRQGKGTPRPTFIREMVDV